VRATSSRASPQVPPELRRRRKSPDRGPHSRPYSTDCTRVVHGASHKTLGSRPSGRAPQASRPELAPAARSVGVISFPGWRRGREVGPDRDRDDAVILDVDRLDYGSGQFVALLGRLGDLHAGSIAQEDGRLAEDIGHLCVDASLLSARRDLAA
jgi:hypothetical protein